jgi:hypothetical protein
MNTTPRAHAPLAVMAPPMLRSTPALAPKPSLTFTQGPLQVLQSNRASTQLSLFGRPRHGR